MPLGILTDEEFEIELNKTKGIIPPVGEIIPIPTVGRIPDKPNLPESFRKVIADEKLEGSKTKDIAEAFGISHATVFTAANGLNSPNGKVNDSLTEHVKSRKERIVDRASNKLIVALRALTPQKIEAEDAKTISSIAKDMSQVVRNLEPDTKGASANQANFIFYAPNGRKDIADYEIIEARD
jgi:hypothetical protein